MTLNFEQLGMATNWEIAGASGVTASVETPLANFSLSGGFAKFPLINTKTKQQIVLEGWGLGGGLGVSTPNLGPLSASGSLDEFPADGIGKILKGPSASKSALHSNDFVGSVAVLTASAGSHASVSAGAVLWLKDLVSNCLVMRSNCSKKEILQAFLSVALLPVRTSPVTPVAAADLAARTKAIGHFAGLGLDSSILQANLSLEFYQMSLA